MKKYITYAVSTFFLISVTCMAASDESAIEAKEKAAWQAFKDKNADDFKKVVAADFVGVYADGIVTFQAELDDMQKSNLTSFSLSDYKAVAQGPDTMVTTYKVTMEGTNGRGKDMSGVYNAGTVWKKQRGDWMAIFHTNVKAEEGAAVTSPTASP